MNLYMICKNMWKKLVANKYLGLLWAVWAVVLVVMLCSIPDKEKAGTQVQADELPHIDPLPKRELSESFNWALPEPGKIVTVKYSFTPVLYDFGPLTDYDFTPTTDYDFTPTIVEDVPTPHKEESYPTRRRRGFFRRR